MARLDCHASNVVAYRKVGLQHGALDGLPRAGRDARVLGEAIDYARQGITKVAEARGKR